MHVCIRRCVYGDELLQRDEREDEKQIEPRQPVAGGRIEPAGAPLPRVGHTPARVVVRRVAGNVASMDVSSRCNHGRLVRGAADARRRSPPHPKASDTVCARQR